MTLDNSELDSLLFDINDKNYEVEDIIEKYSIIVKKNPLIESKENSFVAVFEYIQQLHIKDNDIPEDIKILLKEDLEFKEFYKNEIKIFLKEFTTNSSTLFFEQLINITNLLSLNTRYEIFEDYNNYSMDNLSKLLKDYELQMKINIEESYENFNITFTLYTYLLELLTSLCRVNILDIYRRKTIPLIIELITESINILKLSIPLDENKIFTLNNIQGQLMFGFAHIGYIDTKDKEFNYILDEYLFLFERQISGFELCIESNFGNNIENRNDYFLQFLKNVSYLILTMFNKLEENYSNKINFSVDRLEEFAYLYKKHCNFFYKEHKIRTIENFKQILLNNFTYLYKEPFDEVSFNHKVNSIINDFILQGNKINYANLELIHHVLIFDTDIEEKDLLTIGHILVESQKINNDTIEFFKLKILDIILSKFINKENQGDIGSLIKKVIQYIENNKLASHLISMYSKIYLTIALYYSYKNNIPSLEYSKKLYYIFVKTNGFSIFEKDYNHIFKELQYNYGKRYISSLNILNHNITKKEYQSIGLSNMHEYLKYKNLELKSKVYADISNIVNNILNKDGLDDTQINMQISHFLSQKLFLGLAIANIKNLTKSPELLKGYEKISLPLIDKYAIEFIYPKIYKETFYRIFKSNQTFIEQNIKNILVGYLKNRELYIDSVTNLQNLHKLNKDISHYQNEQLTFMEIHLDNLEVVNKKLGFAVGDIYLKAIAEKISEKLMGGKIYRLSGVRIGILLSINDTYQDLISFLRKLNIIINNENITTTFSIGVAIGSKQTLLKKSSLALNEAMNNDDKFCIKT